MTQEDKELLLKDLCARLPYGVKASTKVGSNIIVSFIGVDTIIGEDGDSYDISFITPYLFPLSSMTEEQLKDLSTYYAKDSKIITDNAIKSLVSPLVMYKAAHVCLNTLEWYNKNHFDYRGLIEKSLALDATGKGIY